MMAEPTRVYGDRPVDEYLIPREVRVTRLAQTLIEGLDEPSTADDVTLTTLTLTRVFFCCNGIRSTRMETA